MNSTHTTHTISRAAMLAAIVSSGDVPFRLAFVKATGKEAGQITEKVCYYGAPNPEPRASGTPAPSPRRTHLESNTLPLTEFGSRRNTTPFISHILKYNGKQVIH